MEGFADFFAVFLIGELVPAFSQRSLYYAESVWRTYGGVTTEGSVGAFFLDLADDSSSPDAITGDDDPAAYGGSYVADGVKRCHIYWVENVSQVNQDGIVQRENHRAQDARHLLQCYHGSITTLPGGTTKNTLDSQNNIIQMLLDQATAVTGAPGWTAANVRSIWTLNI